ncbi:MAG: hypothetical protein GX877_00845 [Bacteroidales bacterium]|nr:hypothetical protein [Bacteroidales bacterium]
MKKIQVLFLLLTVACGTAGKIGWENVPPFLNTEKKILFYDFQMKYKNKQVDGLLLVERNAVNKPRFVLTSHFGVSLFDLEGTEDGYTTHFAIDFPDKKKALDLVWKDLSLLYDPSAGIGYAPIRNSEGKVETLQSGTGIYKTKMKMENYKEGYPKNIKIEHPLLQVSLFLTRAESVEETLYY